MAKKAKPKAKDDEKPAKGAATKPIKVVTFETPTKPDPPERAQFSDNWQGLAQSHSDETAASGPAAWGENEGGGWNHPPSSAWAQPAAATGWNSSTPDPLPVPPPLPPAVRSPPSHSPPPPRAPEVGARSPKDSRGPMLDEPHDDYHTWDSHHHHHHNAENHDRWGGSQPPLSNAPSHIAPTHSSAESHPPPPTHEPQSFTAAAAAMRNVKYTSASEMARRNARMPAAPQPSTPQPAPAPPIPPAPVPPTSGMHSHPHGHPPTSSAAAAAHHGPVWGAKPPMSIPSSPPSANRFGNRDDYAIVAAALDRDIKKAAAAAGHYNPKQQRQSMDSARWDTSNGQPGWGQQKAGSQMQQGKRSSGGWPQPGGGPHSQQGGWPQPAGADGWGAHQGGEGEWGANSKRRSGGGGGGGGWGGGSESGWNQNDTPAHHPTLRRQPNASSSKQPQMSKTWQQWGRDGERESEESEEEDGDDWEDDDWYADQQHKKEQWGHQGRNSVGKDTSGWNTSGGDWGMNSTGWDQPQADHGWGGGGGGDHKVITDPPENAGSRNILSPQQRSQILNMLLKPPQGQSSQQHQQSSRFPNGVTLSDNPVPPGGSKGHKPESSWGQTDAWGAHDSGWGPIHEEDEDESDSEDEFPRPPAKSHDPWSNKLDDTSYSMPSKTMAYAYKDTTASPLNQGKPRDSMQDYTTVQFIESHSAALKPVEQALFGKARWAKDRIHWMFPPDKDERVSMLLAWIESMSYHLAGLGLHKFLQTRERGALITNAAFRLPQYPDQPVFDWLTFDQLQDTMDKTMQESVVFYDPAMQVIIFVLLPSKSGNSVAMWRRKINVPNNTRLRYQSHVTQAVAGLKKEKDYTVYVDRLPLKPEDPDKPKSVATPNTQTPKRKQTIKKLPKNIPKDMHAPASVKKKRKWWQIFK